MGANRAKRLIARRCSHHGVVPMDYRGKVYFGQEVRRPIKLNDTMLSIKTMTEPVCSFNEGDFLRKYLSLRIPPQTSIVDWMLADGEKEIELKQRELDEMRREVAESYASVFVNERQFFMGDYE